MTVALFRIGRLLGTTARLFNHLAAGTLRVDDLRMGIEHSWEDFPACEANVAAGLLPWEEEIVSQFVKIDDRVLLVGSGPGRDLIPLVERGYRVTGLEPARRAITTARSQLQRRGLSAEIVEGFIEDAALAGTFDVIIFSHCCYSFIPESRRRIAALGRSCAHLGPGGRVVISYMTEHSGRPVLMQLARMAAMVSRSDWRPEPGDILNPVDPARPLFHYEHPFTRAEIETEARAAGLRVVFHRDRPPPGVIVLERL